MRMERVTYIDTETDLPVQGRDVDQGRKKVENCLKVDARADVDEIAVGERARDVLPRSDDARGFALDVGRRRRRWRENEQQGRKERGGERESHLWRGPQEAQDNKGSGTNER